MARFTWLPVVAWLLFGLAQAAHGQSASPANGEALIPAEVSAAFAKKVEQAVAARGARVAIVARKGRSTAELPPGIEYTHVAIAMYSALRLDDGRTVHGYALHNLYQREDRLDRSRIVVDFPAEFFAAASSLDAAVIIPRADLQQRLYQAVIDGTFTALHNPRYSAISNPFDSRYQNCTEHLLDVVNAAIFRTTDRGVLKQVARDWFRPQPLNVGAFTLLLGGLFSQEVAIADHRGAAYTATFGSLRDYLATHRLVEAVLRIDPDGITEIDLASINAGARHSVPVARETRVSPTHR